MMWRPKLLLYDQNLLGIGHLRWAASIARAAVSGLNWASTHVDAIDWRGARGFVGTYSKAANLVDQLTDRRQGRCGTRRARRATGILSRHLKMTVNDWQGVEMACSILTTPPAVTNSRFVRITDGTLRGS
jgi:hypothetical protein